MRHLVRFAGVAAIIAASISCGDVSRQGRSPVYLVIDSLTATNGNVLLSDVVRLITAPEPCSPLSPCPTILNDMASVTLRAPLKDVTGSTSLSAPTTNNEVTISRYHVTFKRADGRNTQGVDVPFAFDGAVTGTVGAGSTLGLSFELVRHLAKEEAPLFQLRNSTSIIATIAEITFYGTDRVGNAISVTGTMTVNFGNFGDSL